MLRIICYQVVNKLFNVSFLNEIRLDIIYFHLQCVRAQTGNRVFKKTTKHHPPPPRPGRRPDPLPRSVTDMVLGTSLFPTLLPTLLTSHSSQFKGLCSTKSSNETFQNMPYFIDTKIQSCLFYFSLWQILKRFAGTFPRAQTLKLGGVPFE